MLWFGYFDTNMCISVDRPDEVQNSSDFSHSWFSFDAKIFIVLSLIHFKLDGWDSKSHTKKKWMNNYGYLPLQAVLPII